jgi:hypothetical protein
VIQAVGAIGQYSDPEYLKIIQELMKLGIAPSGNKSIDKAKLEKAQQKTESKFEIDKTQNNNQKDEQQTKKEQMEEQRVGATNLAEINKVLLGLI